MPVIWHDAIGQDPHRNPLLGLCQDSLERMVIAWSAEYYPSVIGPVQNVENQVCRRCSSGTPHGCLDTSK